VDVEITRKLPFVGAAVGAMLLAGALAGCAPNSLALRAAATPTPSVAARSAPGVAGASTARGVPVAGGVVVQGGSAAAGPAAGVVTSAPAAISGRAEVVQPPPSSATGSARGIEVTGLGQIEAQPDEAIVDAGVQTRAATAQDAQATNNKTMQAVLDAIKAVGIPAKDIQTTDVSLYPIIDQGDTVSGYNASNSVTVTVENVGQAGAVLDAAVKAGANTANGIRFTFKDQTTLRNKALAAAAADARSKADVLAAALGLQISGVQSVTEGQVNIPIPFAAPRALAGAAPSQAVPVEPGQQTVTAEVTVVFGY